MPHNHGLDRLHVQSQRHHVPADRISRHVGSVRELPRQQQLHDIADELLWLPRDGLQRDDQPKSRRGRSRVCAGELQLLPHDHGMDLRDLQPHVFPGEPWRRQRRLRHLPYEFFRLLDFPMHRLPHQVGNRSQAQRRERLCLEQRELLSVPQELSTSPGGSPANPRREAT